MTTSIETRAVLAGAYRGSLTRRLTHACHVDADGVAVAVLCARVALDNLADRHACDPHAAVTCATCRRVATRIDLRGQK